LKDHLHIIPTIEELITDPQKVETLSPQEAMNVLTKISSIQICLVARVASNGIEKKEIKATDRLLTAKEAGERLGYSRDWIYRHSKKLPFIVRVTPDRIKVSEIGLEKYIKNRPS